MCRYHKDDTDSTKRDEAQQLVLLLLLEVGKRSLAFPINARGTSSPRLILSFDGEYT